MGVFIWRGLTEKENSVFEYIAALERVNDQMNYDTTLSEDMIAFYFGAKPSPRLGRTLGLHGARLRHLFSNRFPLVPAINLCYHIKHECKTPENIDSNFLRSGKR